MIPWLEADDPFPPLDAALTEPNGLLAAGGDLSPHRLCSAYAQGIFPWFNPGEPLLWWSPDPRTVLIPRELHVRRSLRKRLRRQDYEVRVDTAFGEVIAACAAPRDGRHGTWITEHMVDAYCALHAAGIAHSVETWIDGRLAGGLYGLALGRVFFGESMFTRVPDASKIAFVCLVQQLARWDFGLIDCQMRTDHLASFGAREIPRRQFAERLSELIHCAADDGRGRTAWDSGGFAVGAAADDLSGSEPVEAPTGRHVESGSGPDRTQAGAPMQGRKAAAGQ